MTWMSFLPIENIEKVLGEIGKTLYEPLQEEREEELIMGETSIDKHLQALNTLVNTLEGQQMGN
jgi:hypothetical protein